MSRAAAEVGSTANSYQILAKLATGGMAEIFLARGEAVAGVERYCVLKRILRERAGDVHFVRMFLDEARLAAQLQHPNIAQVYDIGKLGDSFFFTMEYVHGETVRALLHRAQGLRRKLPINCVLTIAAGTAAGLHHAHTRLGRDGRALGIVHRDVSPSNLMVSYEGSVKVVDFGVAKASDRSHETKSGTVKGKISYLSPEQCKGKRVDRRSDLFSLGICLWEMLTTERLFKRASDFENMNAIVTEATPPPSSRRPDVSPELDALVLRLLAKTPEERFQTADELVEAIEEVASRTGSVLSVSALGRFMRELFGQRPEPWLELESQQEHGEAVTVTSEPIPRELGIPAAEEIDRQLAGVVNLGPPPSVTESLDLAPVPVLLDGPAGRSGKLAALDPLLDPSLDPSLAFPLAAPPPTQPWIAPLAAVPAVPGQPAPPATTGPPVAVPPPPGAPEQTQSLSYSLALPAGQDDHTEALPQAEPPPSADAPTPSPGPVVPGTGVGPLSGSRSGLIVAPVAPSGPRSGAMAVPAGAIVTPPASRAVSAVSIAVPIGSRATSSGPFVASPGPEGASRGSGAYGTPARRRAAWPLYAAIIGGAALLGSIPVAIMMRTDSAGIRVDARSVSKPPASAIAGAAITAPVITPIDPPPEVPPPEVPAMLPAAAPGPSLAAAEPAAVEPAAGSAAAGSRAAGEVAKGSGGAGDQRAAVRPMRGSASGVVAPPARKPQPARTAAGPRAGQASAGGPSRSAAALVAGSNAGRREAPDDEISRSFAEGRYDKVVTLCGAGPVSAEHAPICLIAACHAGNEAKARRFLSAVPIGRREQLTTNCKQLGVDLAATRKPAAPPADKPADSCEADPMACQH